MTTMFNGIKRFVREEDGAAAIEYALLAAFISLVLVAVLPGVKTTLNSIWTKIATGLTTANT